MNNPKISLILPIRNRAKLFKAALDSYVAQTLSPHEFEIIIVDQQSDDGLLELIEQYKTKLNLRLYDIDINTGQIKPNVFGGLSNPALPQNFGVRQARGDIIILTSPEVVFAENNLAGINTLLRRQEFMYGHVINARHYKFDNFGIEYLRQINGEEYCGPSATPKQKPWAYFIGAIHKEDFLSVGGIEELFMLGIGNDDHEFGLRLMSAGYKLTLNDAVFGIHQTHNKMKTQRDKLERRYGLHIAFNIFHSLFPENKPNKHILANANREFGIAEAKLVMTGEPDISLPTKKEADKKPISEMLTRFLSEKISSKFIEWLDDNKHDLFNIKQKEPEQIEKSIYIKKPSNIMLHFNQAFWRGGSILFMRDMARAYPEFQHITCFFYDGREDYEMANEFRYEGIEVCRIEKLTEKLVEDIDPVLMVFHNTEGKNVEGEWPFSWLKRWPLMAVHHNKSQPCFYADVDIFVSQALLDQYKNIQHRMNYRLIPPCIDLRSYQLIERKENNDRCVIGKLTSDYHTRFPPELPPILNKVNKEVPHVDFVLVGGAKYWGKAKLPSCSMPSIGSKDPAEFYRSFDIFVHMNKKGTVDSWGRVISEAMASGLPVVCQGKGGPAEQVTHGETGFLCNTDDDYVKYLSMLACDAAMRYEMGMKARDRALSEFGIERFRKETVDIVLKAALGVI